MASQEGLPICNKGHSRCWALVRALGHRLDLVCVGISVRQDACGTRKSVFSRPQGFRDQSKQVNEYNGTKIKVLDALSRAHPQGLALGQVVAVSGLTPGQVQGSLTRLVKSEYIERSAEKEVLAPVGKGYVYALAWRGAEFLVWAANQGLL